MLAAVRYSSTRRSLWQHPWFVLAAPVVRVGSPRRSCWQNPSFMLAAPVVRANSSLFFFVTYENKMKIHTLLHLSMLNKLYISALMKKNLVYIECIFECISVFSYKYTHKYAQDTHKIHTIFY